MSKQKDIICWWSGGVTSAVAISLTIEIFGLDRCRIVFIDTKNEDQDTYRFKSDCQKWYGKEIETLSVVGHNKKYSSIEDVWFDFNSLNVAHGAICSSELKRQVRLDFQKRNNFSHQVFGYDIDEPKRAKNMKNNYPISNPIFPLLMYGISKKMCFKILETAGIQIPLMYKLGFHNNNCFKTGCVQAGVGYWKKMKNDFPEKFNKMAKVEHDLTDKKGKPVTILKDQSNAAKSSGIFNVFLLPHKDYPNHKDINMMKGRDVEPLVECNGFCNSNKGQLSLQIN